MIANATQKLNSLAKKTSLGDVLNVFPRNGCVTVTPIVLTELMRIRRFITAQHHSLVLTINSLAKMDDASTKVGLAITTTIVVTAQMKESSATHNTRLVRPKSSLVRTSNASEINIVVVRTLLKLKTRKFLKNHNCWLAINSF